MRFKHYLFVATVAVAGGAATLPLKAQITPINFTGATYSQNFDGIGPVGTTTPAGWNVSRGSNGFFITFTNGPLVVNNGSIAPDGTTAWNCGTSGAADRSLGIAATSSGTAGTSNQERYVFFFLRNNTGSAIDTFELRYKGEQWRTPGAGSAPTFIIPLLYSTNFQNFYSMGTNFALPCLQYTPVNSAQDGNTPANSRAGIGGLFTLPAPLTNGGLLSFWWFDANESGTEPVLAIDDFSFALPSGPPVLISSPTNVVAEERQPATLRVGVTGALMDFHWFHDDQPVLSSSNCYNGANHIISASGPNLTISSVEPADAGVYYCIASNALGSVISDSATLTVNADLVAPRLLFASADTNPGVYVLHLSEPLNDACLDIAPGIGGGLVTQPSTWYIDEIVPGVGERQLGLAGFTNSPNVTGARTLGLIAGLLPLDPANPIRITLVETLADTAAAQNTIPVGTVIYVANGSNELVSLSHVWRYNDQDIDPGPNWFQPAFDASAFPEGPGPFDTKRGAGGDAGVNCRDNIGFYGLGQVGTCIRLLSPLPPGTNNLITANFWTRFQFDGDPGPVALRWNGKVDDGAVIYLNGQELQRVRMPAAPAVITRANFSAGAVGDTAAQDSFEFLSPAALQRGENTLAVELHQSDPGSSDLTMAMHVYTLTAPLPKLQATLDAGNIVITWQPAFGELQYSDDLSPGSWNTIPGAVSGHSEPAAGNRFFRVRLP